MKVRIFSIAMLMGMFFMFLVLYYSTSESDNTDKKKSDYPYEVWMQSDTIGSAIVLKQGKNIGGFKMYFIKASFAETAHYFPSIYQFQEGDSVFVYETRYNNCYSCSDFMFQLLPK